MDTVTSVRIRIEVLDWIKDKRINLSDFIEHKILELMQQEKDKLRNPMDKLEDIQQKKFQLELQEKFILEQQQVKAAEFQAIEEQERARKLERAAHQFLAEDVYNGICIGQTLSETKVAIEEFVDKNPSLNAYILAEIPELQAWYQKQLKIIEAAKNLSKHTL